MKRLIVNADDFGFTTDVNRGIVHAHTNGILTATTLMANGRAFDDAVRLSREHPTLDIGCHLVLVQGESVLPGAKPFPKDTKQLTLAVLLGRIRIYDELKAQVEKILAAGIPATHLDTHKHTHILPPILEAVLRLAKDFRIPWIRRPLPAVDFGLQGKLKRYNARATDHFAGFRLTGKFGPAELAKALAQTKEGLTEFMCHPAFCTDELRASQTRLKESRQRELDALVSPEVRSTLILHGIELTNYRQD